MDSEISLLSLFADSDSPDNDSLGRLAAKSKVVQTVKCAMK